MKGGDMSLPGRIREIMEGGNEHTAAEVADLLGASKKRVREVLSIWVKEDSAHVSRYVGPRHEKVFRYGAGESVAPLLSSTTKGIRRRLDARRRRAVDRNGDRPAEPIQGVSERERDKRYCLPATW